MSIYSTTNSDVSRKAAIVELLTNAATEAGTQIHSVGGQFHGPLSAYQIRMALGCSTDITNRLIEELVVATTIQRITGNSENIQDWRYTVT